MRGSLREHMALKGKRARFAVEYLKDCNATQAAIRAGYTEESARNQGYRLKTNDDVLEAIEAGAARILKKLDLGVERIVGETARIAVADIADLVDEDELPLPLPRLPVSGRRAVASVKFSREKIEVKTEGETTTTTRLETIEIKFWDKLRALELLAKFKGLLKPEVKVEAGDSWRAVLLRMNAEDREQGTDDA